MNTSQSLSVRPSSQTDASPPPPYNNKEEAKKWLDQILKIQNITGDLHEKAVKLKDRINTKGQPWDKLKPELEYLHYEVFQWAQQQPARQQIESLAFLEVGIPAPVLRDPRVDVLVQRFQELDVAKKLKGEITTDMENTKIRLKSDIDDNFNKIKQLKSDLAERDETIVDLRNKLKQLAKEKEELENKIKSLENEIRDLKQEVGQLQVTMAEKDQKIEKIMERHAKEMGTVTDEANQMKIRIKGLEDRNEELAKMNESRIVVGETMKILVKAIYKHVHPTLQLRKRTFYAVCEIADHLDTKYRSNPSEKVAAEGRWNRLKGKLTFNSIASCLICLKFVII